MCKVPKNFDCLSSERMTSLSSIVMNRPFLEVFAFLANYVEETRTFGNIATELDLTVGCLNGKLQAFTLYKPISQWIKSSIKS